MKVRLTRILVYEGDINWLKPQIANSLTGTRIIKTKWGEATITARTIEEVPEVVPEKETSNDS